jgi:glycosyltransferase involved in cell wall biosynthesis
MRIAQFLAQYPGRDGTSAYGTGLAAAMHRRWPGTCPILSYRTDGREAPAGVEVLCHPRRGKNPFGVPAGLAQDLLANRHQLDGVVLHGTYNPPNAGLARALRRAGIPYLFMPHDPYVRELRDHHPLRKAVYWRLFEKPLIEGARAVQLLDATHEAPLRELGCRVPVFSIPNGCDPAMLDALDPENTRRPGAVEGETKLLYLGRMDRNHKGLDLLLDGFARFCAADPAAAAGLRLVLTGNDWSDRAALESMTAALGITGRVTFTGARREASIQLHSEADLVVLPSRFDGFGLTIVEAMLAARPVLVSRRAGVASHVELAGGGFLMDPTPESIQAALAAAMSRRSGWADLGEMNRDYVLHQLTWDQVAARTMAEYQRLFGRGGSALDPQ